MPTPIRLIVGPLELRAELNDSPTAQAIAAALPISARGNIWGEEIYFSIPVAMDADDSARDTFDIGELGYWPPGNAFCIFYGPTPASTDGTPKMANPGNPIGQILDNAAVLRSVSSGVVVEVKADTSEQN